MAGKKGMVHYSIDVKLKAVRLFYEVGMTRAEIVTFPGLRNGWRVKEWVRTYRREGV